MAIAKVEYSVSEEAVKITYASGAITTLFAPSGSTPESVIQAAKDGLLDRFEEDPASPDEMAAFDFYTCADIAVIYEAA